VPYAPDDGGRSYSYRLIAHIHECVDDWPGAISAIHSCLRLSPDYPDGLYDFARHVCVTDEALVLQNCADTLRGWGGTWQRASDARNVRAFCALALGRAIEAKPVFFYLAQKEATFASRRQVVDSLLAQKLRNARTMAEQKLADASKAVEEVSCGLTELCASKLTENGRLTFGKANDLWTSGDYAAALEARPLAEKALDEILLARREYDSLRSEVGSAESASRDADLEFESAGAGVFEWGFDPSYQEGNCTEGRQKLRSAADALASGDYAAIIQARQTAREAQQLLSRVAQTLATARSSHRSSARRRVLGALRYLPMGFLFGGCAGGIAGVVAAAFAESSVHMDADSAGSVGVVVATVVAVAVALAFAWTEAKED